MLTITKYREIARHIKEDLEAQGYEVIVTDNYNMFINVSWTSENGAAIISMDAFEGGLVYERIKDGKKIAYHEIGENNWKRYLP